jgi:hypothetical protein
VETLLALLEGAEVWWPGGSKELQQALPEWAACERKIEMFHEFARVYADMAAVSLAATPLQRPGQHFEQVRKPIVCCVCV